MTAAWLPPSHNNGDMGSNPILTRSVGQLNVGRAPFSYGSVAQRQSTSLLSWMSRYRNSPGPPLEEGVFGRLHLSPAFRRRFINRRHMVPSTNRSGHHSFKVTIWVRIPLELPSVDTAARLCLKCVMEDFIKDLPYIIKSSILYMAERSGLHVGLISQFPQVRHLPPQPLKVMINYYHLFFTKKCMD